MCLLTFAGRAQLSGKGGQEVKFRKIWGFQGLAPGNPSSSGGGGVRTPLTPPPPVHAPDFVGFCDDEASCVISLNWSVELTLVLHVDRLYPHIIIFNSL